MEPLVKNYWAFPISVVKISNSFTSLASLQDAKVREGQDFVPIREVNICGSHLHSHQSSGKEFPLIHSTFILDKNIYLFNLTKYASSNLNPINTQ